MEAGEFESVLIQARREELKAIARNAVRKDKRINIRIFNRDLTAFQSRVSDKGIPYQAFL